jgi:hypothetical protein
MTFEKKEYDFICSLGGSCASAFQLKFRSLRFASLPFDWLFTKEPDSIIKLADCFKDDFKNWLLYENMEEVPEKERGDSKLFQYKDKATGYQFIHDFEKPLSDSNQFNYVKTKYEKRIKRLYNFIDRSKNILFILDTNFSLNEKIIQKFLKTINKKWPEKNIDFIQLEFNANEDSSYIKDKIQIYKTKRGRNSYDFSQTNFDWNFLDSFKISEAISVTKFHKFFEIKKLHRGVGLYILKIMPHVTRIRWRFLDMRLDFCLGKEKI